MYKNLILVGISICFASMNVQAEGKHGRVLKEWEVYTTPNVIIFEYGANELAADNKYKNKPIVIEGTIFGVKSDMDDMPYVIFKNPNGGFNTVNAHFFDSERDKLMSFSRGAKIAANCIGDGAIMGNPQLKSCTLDPG
ncbi:hypothetical protein I7V27_13375 [Lelliottia amnigena]|uniref:Uncharacterized protein n=1 Tax=Lelliottia amnigena TaxID=61646 RepID=A0AAP2F1I8_LELAM|nr:hypothetical protein [Lelliottia amnigena]MBL5899915.1 hypothetical protein [Lelliottia amnigena]MBL5935429.1 hypothetical protein [Lelliottia amnigena]